MSRKKIILLSSIGLVVLMIYFVSHSQSSKASMLKGTFISDDYRFNTIVFDYEENQTFYFYNENDAQIGSYEKIKEGSYRVHGTNLDIQEVRFDGHNEIELIIDGISQMYRKESDLPTIME